VRLTRLAARAVRLTHLVDRAYRKFDRIRSSLLLATGSDAFFDEYNKLAFGGTAAYRADSPAFRRGLFDWEADAIRRYFPPPPGRVLIGGAGGGREALGLIEQGYSVLAFDPAVTLVDGMRTVAGPGGQLTALCGSYAELPRLTQPGGGIVDLASQPPFDAAIVGWASFSHLRTDAERTHTLRAFAQLTRGPILVSYFGDPAPVDTSPATGGLRGWLARRSARRGRSVFSVQVGYYRLLRHEEMEGLVRSAGLKMLGADRGGNWPYVVVAAEG
jgi:hypothetical protein